MTDVRTLLHDLAADAPRGHGEETADRVVDLHRAQDRRRLRLASVAVAIALVVVAVPALVTRPSPADTAAVASADGTAESLFDVPTRGSLAGDEDVVAAALAASWGDGIPYRDAGDILDPAPENRHVAFVGEVPGGEVWALVMGRTGPQLAYAWFVGAQDTAGTSWTLATIPERTFAGIPVALLDSAGEHGPMVVVAMPDEVITLVPFADGPDLPQPRSSAADDGVALLDVQTPEGAELPGYEVRGGSSSPAAAFRPLQFDSTDQGSYAAVVSEVLRAVSEEGTGPRTEQCLVQSGWLVRAPDGSLSWPYLATGDDLDAFRATVEACRSQGLDGD